HLHRALAVCGDADDSEVILQLQQRRQGAAQHGLVVDDDQADALGVVHHLTSTSVPPLSPERTDSVAPPVVARSRIPRRPFPSVPVKPCPSSVTAKTPGAMRTVTAEASACRSTLVVASRRIQLAVSDW